LISVETLLTNEAKSFKSRKFLGQTSVGREFDMLGVVFVVVVAAAA